MVRENLNRLWTALPDGMRSLARVYGMLLGASSTTLVWLVVLFTVTAAAPAGSIWAIKELIDAVANGLQDQGFGEALVWLAILVVVWMVQIATNGFLLYYRTLLSEVASTVSRERLYGRASTLDLAFYDDAKRCDELYLAHDEMYRVEQVIWASLETFQSVLGLAALFAVLSILHPLASVVILLSSLPRAMLEGRVGKWRLALETRHTRNHRIAAYIGWLLTTRENAKEVRVMNLTRRLLARFRAVRGEYVASVRRVAMKIGLAEGFLEVVSILGVASVCAWSMLMYADGAMTVGGFAMTLQAAQQMRGGLATLMRSLGAVYQHSLFLQRFFALIDSEHGSIEASNGRATIQESGASTTAGLSVEDVWFRYPGTERWVLRGVSFDIAPGSCVAIVGENGEGKTTTIDLLLRLYDPDRGRVTLGGTDLRDFDVADLRSRMGVCFQEFVRYDFSLRDNIELGHLGEENDRGAQHEKAIELAGIEALLGKLPHGLETTLGRTLDGGVDLSGGDWQKVAIARSAGTDAPIMILDEPSASLDALAESALLDRIANLVGRKTMLIVSHRLASVKFADQIVVLANGIVEEKGTHQELMELQGRYAEMFRVQARRYGGD